MLYYLAFGWIYIQKIKPSRFEKGCTEWPQTMHYFIAVLAFYGVYCLVVKLKTKKTTADFEIEQKEELTV